MNKELTKIYKISIFTSFLLLIVGIFITFYPTLTMNILSTIVGVAILFISINYLIRYFKFKEYNLKLELISGVFLFALSLLFIFNNNFIVSILPFLMGIYFISNSIPKIQYSLELKNIGNSTWVSSFIISAICLIIGVIFLVNPFNGAVVITKVIGIFIMIYSIMDIINYCLIDKNMR